MFCFPQKKKKKSLLRAWVYVTHDFSSLLQLFKLSFLQISLTNNTFSTSSACNPDLTLKQPLL